MCLQLVVLFLLACTCPAVVLARLSSLSAHLFCVCLLCDFRLDLLAAPALEIESCQYCTAVIRKLPDTLTHGPLYCDSGRYSTVCDIVPWGGGGQR